MEQKYYAVKDSPLSLSLTQHSGILTERDLKTNLKKAIMLSNEYGEDWIADLKEHWYQVPGMIMSTKDKNLLENEEIMESQIADMLDPWTSHYRTEMLLQEAGVGKELTPLDSEQLEVLENEQDTWTLQVIITEHLPYESPIY